MSIRTLSELRVNIGTTVRETQINSTLTDFINLTLQEIHSYHGWTWKRRKTTFSTVASQEDYNLDEEIDEIAFLRQRSSPTKLLYIPDPDFYRVLPNVEDLGTGPPRYYRLWEETGFSTNLAAADTIYVVSSSASDTSTFKVLVVGRNSSGEVISESLTMNGITNVTSTTTFAASGLMQVSKSANTTGTISVYRTTCATLLAELAPEEATPRYKRLSLYPVPSAAITVYVEYFERLRLLVGDNDVPQMDYKWNWVLREGALAKAWEYKQNDAAHLFHRQAFMQGLAQMKAQDMTNHDYIPVLRPRPYGLITAVRRYNDSVSSSFPSYGLAS